MIRSLTCIIVPCMPITDNELQSEYHANSYSGCPRTGISVVMSRPLSPLRPSGPRQRPDKGGPLSTSTLIAVKGQQLSSASHFQTRDSDVGRDPFVLKQEIRPRSSFVE